MSEAEQGTHEDGAGGATVKAASKATDCPSVCARRTRALPPAVACSVAATSAAIAAAAGAAFTTTAASAAATRAAAWAEASQAQLCAPGAGRWVWRTVQSPPRTRRASPCSRSLGRDLRDKEEASRGIRIQFVIQGVKEEEFCQWRAAASRPAVIPADARHMWTPDHTPRCAQCTCTRKCTLHDVTSKNPPHTSVLVRGVGQRRRAP